MLSISNLSKNFGGFVAIDDVTLDVHPGEAHAIIGPNGAGKSTLFDLVSGVLTPNAGSVLFRGKRLDRLQTHEIVRLGIARSFQRVSIFPRETVYANAQVAVIARAGDATRPFRSAAGLYRDEVAELLAVVGLADDADRQAGQLAYGKQKQLELALALAAQPTLLLLDEPTAGMSVGETAACLALINRIKEQRRLTVLFTEHDMEFVFQMASRVSVLHHGRIVASGSPREVRENPEVQRIYLGKA